MTDDHLVAAAAVVATAKSRDAAQLHQRHWVLVALKTIASSALAREAFSQQAECRGDADPIALRRSWRSTSACTGLVRWA